MAEQTPASRASGRVYLVGAGPGDPGLLTLRAAELLGSADAVVHEPDCDPALLERCRPGAEIQSLDGSPGAEEVARRLAGLSAVHDRVVRLASGDPFHFGSGGAEAMELAKAGLPFEVVPGVPPATASSTFAGIPLAHPGIASSVAFLRWEENRPDGAPTAARGEGGADTLVVLGGAGCLASVAASLVAAGRSPATPAAAVERGSLPGQRTVVSTLAGLAADVAEAGLGPSTLVVVGEVVRLRERLAWFEALPLFGLRIVITRPRAQAADLVRLLETLGAEVISFPTIRIVEAQDPAPLRRAVRAADSFDWIVFTSVNGVERFWAELRAGGGDTRVLGGVSLCAIGPATAGAIEREGARADLVPREFVAESVVEALEAEGELRGARFLLPRAEDARSTIPDSLRARGAEVVVAPAYRTVQDGTQAGRVRESLRRDEVDVITFTASSTVRNFVELVGTDTGAARIACIGPITAGTARELGLPVHIEAGEYTVPGLVEAIQRHFSSEGPPL